MPLAYLELVFDAAIPPRRKYIALAPCCKLLKFDMSLRSQPPETALTLYWKNGKVATTDGPYAETKEQVGGIQILEARDLNHAVQLVSQLPGFKYGLGPLRYGR